MKKTLVILAMAMISFANAQKGTILVSGSMGIGFNNRSDQGSENKDKVFRISPKVGYQLNDNWTVGVESGFSTSKYEYTYLEDESYNNEIITKNLSAGAFVRYSKSLSQMFSLYADLGAGYKGTKERYNYSISTLNDSTAKFDGFYTSLEPGVFLNIKNNFGLNFSIGGLSYWDIKDNETHGRKQYLFCDFGQSFSIGFSKNF